MKVSEVVQMALTLEHIVNLKDVKMPLMGTLIKNAKRFKEETKKIAEKKQEIFLTYVVVDEKGEPVITASEEELESLPPNSGMPYSFFEFGEGDSGLKSLLEWEEAFNQTKIDIELITVSNDRKIRFKEHVVSIEEYLDFADHNITPAVIEFLLTHIIV